MEKERENCPECKIRCIKEELLFIPARERRLQHLYCAQCHREYPCDNQGKIVKNKRIICY